MHYTKFLKWGVLAGLVLTLFVPFIVASGSFFPSMFFPYITGKNFAFRILVEIILGLYVLLAIRDPKYRPKSSWLMWAICLFVAWVGLATILSVDPIKSFWSNFERMDGYITLIHLFAYVVITSAMLTAEKWWEKFFQIAVSASVLEALYSLAQVFHVLGLSPSSQSGVRADGTFGNATYLAVYMLFSIFITLFLLAGVFKEKNAWRSSQVLVWFYGFAALLQFLVIFFTETRGAILGLVGGLIVAALYIIVLGMRRQKTIWFKGALGLLLTIVVLAGTFIALRNTSFIQNTPGLSRLASISLNDSTTRARLFYIWPMALQGAMERPVFGWGQENFNFIFNAHYNPAMYGQEQWFDRAHNEFLDWLVAAGIPALLLYISFFLLAALAVVRSKTLSTPQQALLLGVLAAYAFNNLLVFDNLLSLVYFYMLLAFAHSMSSRELPRLAALTKAGSDRAIAALAPIVVVGVVASLWVLNGPAVSRAQILIEALQPTNPKTGVTYTVADHLGAFTRALEQGELGRQETTEQLFQFVSNSVAPSTSVSPEDKQKAFTLARNAGLALMEQRKGDARIELFVGVFYSQFGQYAEALVQYNKALTDSPNKQQILFQTGVVYLQQGDTKSALALFKKAYDLEPAYPDARILYATGLLYAKQSAQADALLTEGFGTVSYDDNRLLQTYMTLKMYDRAVAIWDNRIKAAPTDTNLLLGLAGVYFASGNIAQTIATIRRIEELDPSSKAQMESIITQIQNGTLKAQ